MAKIYKHREKNNISNIQTQRYSTDGNTPEKFTIIQLELSYYKGRRHIDI